MATDNCKMGMNKTNYIPYRAISVRVAKENIDEQLPNSLIKEDVIHESAKCNFLPGESLRSLKIVNRLNICTQTSKTLARYVYTSGVVSEKTSDDIVKLIGQANYDIVFSSLCSVINQELKVRGILALLTTPVQTSTISCQVNFHSAVDPIKIEDKPRPEGITRRKRKKQAPYVVKDEPKKVVIQPSEFKTFLECVEPGSELLDIKGQIFDENSNDSSISKISVVTLPELLKDPVSLLDNVDRHTQDSKDHRPDILNSTVHVDKVENKHELMPSLIMCKQEESCHFANREAMRNISMEERKKLHLRQAMMDYKRCLVPDVKGNYPIHHAVIEGDREWLRRQCLMLKIRNETVDILAGNNTLTALMISLYQEDVQLTAMLLCYGADPLLTDEDHRTAFHVAAETEGGHLKAIINHCRRHARQLLQEEEKLWKPEYEQKDDAELAQMYLRHACSMYNDQGYSPLMLASKLGKFENVQLLLDIVPGKAHVNSVMPNSGETALYVAVGATVICSIESGDKSKVAPHFKKTLLILIQNGADPNISNFSNSTVHDLVLESACAELGSIIGNAVTSKLYAEPLQKDFGSLMLLKEKDQSVIIREMKKNTRKVSLLKPSVKTTIQPAAKPGMTTARHANQPDVHVTKPDIEPVFRPFMKPDIQYLSKRGIRRVTIPGIHPFMKPVAHPATKPVSQPVLAPVSTPGIPPVTIPAIQHFTKPVIQPDYIGTIPVSQTVTAPVSILGIQPVNIPGIHNFTKSVIQPKPVSQPVIASVSASGKRTKSSKIEIINNKIVDVNTLAAAMKRKTNMDNIGPIVKKANIK